MNVHHWKKDLAKPAYVLSIMYMNDDGEKELFMGKCSSTEELSQLIYHLCLTRAVYNVQIFPVESPVSGVNQRNLNKRIRELMRRNG